MDRVEVSPPPRRLLKRKAEETQDNERLSKRLSLLNLERNSQKLYVPVEQLRPSAAPETLKQRSKPRPQQQPQIDNDTMQLDNTAHKVYIYDLDAELSDDESAPTSPSSDGKLTILPSLQHHLLSTRIPPTVLANSDGELAGHNKQMVLYNIPSSLTVPEGKDSVRKAIIESRARARRKIEEERERVASRVQGVSDGLGVEVRDWGMGIHVNGNVPVVNCPEEMFGDMAVEPLQGGLENDPDAMDLG